MTTPSGQISLSQVNTELSYPATQLITMNDTAVRTLAGVPSGAISMQNLQNKSSTFTFTLTGGTNVNLRSAAIAAGWPGSGAVNATMPAAYTIQSASPGSAALVIDGAWPGGVTFNNAGLIVGRGGNGGNGSNSPPSAGAGAPGASGSTAISITSAVSINNTGTIAGGGGGGGGGGGKQTGFKTITYIGGGGGGGGIGISTAGSGGSGRPPGTNGTATSAGTGGVPGSGNNGGNGGGYGSVGVAGTPGAPSPGPGGGAGAAGAATQGAPTYVTWIATGTRYGAIN